ncbi:MAG: hypothetical protein QOI77_433, partial [Blastocatellia bacterium]|nr:hypothetical protein [Blastocatellia bacterium]
KTTPVVTRYAFNGSSPGDSNVLAEAGGGANETLIYRGDCS